MTTVEQETLPVTQADREAAKAVHDEIERRLVKQAANYGLYATFQPFETAADDNWLNQVFARHRADHEPRPVQVGLREALEEVARLSGERAVINCARSALAAQSPAPTEGWQDIASAPKDGTQILVPVGHGIYNAVSWHDGGWREPTNGLRLRNDPAVYMAIPAARPSTQPQADAGSADHSSTREG